MSKNSDSTSPEKEIQLASTNPLIVLILAAAIIGAVVAFGSVSSKENLSNPKSEPGTNLFQKTFFGK